MAENTEGTKKPPKVLVSIPTGPSKDYASFYMVAALENLDYDNFEVAWFITKVEDKADAFIEKINSLMKMSRVKSWGIHSTSITAQELATPYIAVTVNRKAIRAYFLDGDYDYLMIVGGDNPPNRSAVKRLLKCDADAAIGVSYQRPGQDKYFPGSVYPMLWTYAWKPQELEGRNLEPLLLEELRKAFLVATFYVPVYIDSEWDKKEMIEYIAGGDGNGLYSRRVMESVGWTIPASGFHSEDMHFFNYANLLGFKTVADIGYHVPHLAPDGSVY